MKLVIDLKAADLDELNEANEIIHRVINRRSDKIKKGSVEKLEPILETLQNETIQGEAAPDVTEGGLQLRPTENTDVTEDIHGRVWDERIDSTPAGLTEKGEWRARRKPKEMSGVDWKQRRSMIIEELTNSTPADSVFEEPTETGFEDMMGGASDNDNDHEVTYDMFKEMVMAKIMDAKLPKFTPQFANAAAVKHGAQNIQAVEKAPDLIPTLMMELGL